MGVGQRAYEGEIALIAAGRAEPGILEVRRDTPDALVGIGLRDLPMHHTRTHAAAEMAPERLNGHGVDPLVLSTLPELLEHPVAVIESNSRDGVVAVVLDAVAGAHDDPLTAMIDPGARLGHGAGGSPETNFILSVHGRRWVVREVSEAVARGEALLYDGPRFWSLVARCKRSWEELDSRRRAGERGPDVARAGQDGHRWDKMGRARRGKGR